MESLISLYDSNNEEACKEENDGIEYFYEYSNCFLDNSICFEKNKEIMQLSLYETQRAVIIQWICDVCDTYHISIDSISLSVYILDNYCGVEKPLISQLQLIASCCIILSSKYEETYYPSISEFVFLCDGLYNKEEFINMEARILKKIQYRLTRLDARFIARIKLSLMRTKENIDIDPLFYQSVDFVYRSSLYSSYLTFSSIHNYGDCLIDTTNNQEVDEQTQNKLIKLSIIEALEIAKDCSESYN